MCSSLSMYLHAFLLFLSCLLLAQPTQGCQGTDMASTANIIARDNITNDSFFIAKPGCPLYCGNVTVPYPFGFKSGCYINSLLELTCNYTFDPPKLLLGTLEVSSISQTQVRARNAAAVRCYNQAGATSYTWPSWMNLVEGRTFSATANKFTVVGCNVFALIKWRHEDRDFSTGCLSTCSRNSEVLPGNCTGIGCCQIDIPKGLQNFNATATLGRFYSETETEFSSPCTYAFLGERDRFQFNSTSDFNFSSRRRFIDRIWGDVPSVIDFVIGEQNCSEARNLGTLECLGDNTSSSCIDSDSGYGGYLCICKQGYMGNPYLNPGCTALKSVSLHSHASSVPTLNGMNFSEWKEHVEFHLGVLDLDLALRCEKPAALTDKSSAEEKSSHEAWERSNRLGLMFMRMTIANNIKTTLPNAEDAKVYLTSIETRFKQADKSLAGALMAKLTTMKYDGSRGMHEHVLEMTNLAAQLKNLGMSVDEFFLVQFVLNSLSLSPQYEPFQINYNTMKDKWNLNELASMLVQEEARLKQSGQHSAHLTYQGAKKKGMKPKRVIKQEPPKVIESAQSSQTQRKEKHSDRCHFCKKSGHYQKDCSKRRAWFEKKGIPFNPDHKP